MDKRVNLERGIVLKKPNLGYYIQKINDIVTTSEEIGELMNPSYETIRTAIDSKKLADLTSEQLKETKELFMSGTDKYRTLLAEIKGLKAPVKVIGIHKKLEKSFETYVFGCQEMVDSINVEETSVNQEQFNTSETKQDEATDEISFCIQRITQLVMGK
ncbi:hypothetical protein G7082_00420 [Vagococcus hydrophili]|uniref:Uncharacterized protein n=1 Tax=Vagococcus hydrophili TaxID=2714947 RepID=A0A6G8AQ35_9ENTE|nr:hypothetical protein G7082_00420 [Vagococcus hydrophili]